MDATTRDSILRQAERHVQQGRLEAALEEYRKILRAAPRDITVANTVGDLYARLGRNAEAITHYTNIASLLESAGHLPRAAAVYKKIAKLDPSNADAALQLASLYAKQNLAGEAARQYAAAADIYRRAGKAREALRMLEKVVEIAPGAARARIDLACAYEAEGLAAEAAEAYRAAGTLLLQKGKAGESVTALERALALAPESRAALKALASAHMRRGDSGAALDLVARALEAAPHDVDLLVILGRTFLDAGMLDRAESTFERLFRIDPSRYDYLLEVAHAFVQRGEYERTMGIVDLCVDVILVARRKKKATALLKAILERDPSNVHALRRLAGIYRRARERRNLVNALDMLVKAALDRGLHAEAVAALQQLVEIEPREPSYREQLESIGGDEKRLALWVAAAREEEEEEVPGSYGDHSTELLAEMVARHPEFQAARLRLLEQLVAQQPAYVEGRLKLKQLYLDGGEREKAHEQCLALARLYEDAGDAALARRQREEAAGLVEDSSPSVR